MDCVQTRTILLRKDLGDFSDQDVTAAERHVTGCQNCQQFLGYNEQFRQFLQKTLGGIVTHPTVRESLLERLARAQKGRYLSWPKQWVGRAAVVALCILGSALLYVNVVQQHDEVSHPLVSLLIEDHVEFQLRDHPLDLRTSDKAQLEQWFARRVDFAVSVPQVQGATLRGGRLCYLLGKRAALICYEKGGIALSAYILEGERIDFSAMGRVVTANNRRICLGSGKGFHAALWKSSGLIYALISNLHPAELEQIAARA